MDWGNPFSFVQDIWDGAVKIVSDAGTGVVDAVSDAINEVGKGVNDVLGGIFGAHTETTLATYVSRAMPDNLLPNSAQSGILSAALKDGVAGDQILEKMVKSIGTRAESAYRYSKDGYVYGTPTKKLFSGVTGEAVVKSVIRSQFTDSVEFLYYYFGKENYLHHVWNHLVSDYSYSPETNQLPILSSAFGTPVFLKDIVLIVTQATATAPPKGVLEPIGVSPNSGVTPARPVNPVRPHTPVEISPTAQWDRARVDYTWIAHEQVNVSGIVITKEVVKEESLYIDFAGENAVAPVSGDVYQVCYVHAGKMAYWSYGAKAGYIPSIDAVLNSTYDNLGSFYPMVHFRHNRQAVHPRKSTNPYRSSVRMLKYFGLPYDEVAKSIADNPDIASVEQAFMMMAVPAVTTNPLEQRYLFDFFNEMYLAKIATQPDVAFLSLSESSAGALLPSTSLSLVIQDALTAMSLGCSEIRKRIKVGKIGKVGTCTSSISDMDTPIVVIMGTAVGRFGEEGPKITRHTYSRQMTADLYEEVSVFGLHLTYHISGQHQTAAYGSDGNLLIPLDRAITSKYLMKDREVLYARSLHFVINSKKEREVKWYQTALFKEVMLVIAIVMTVVSIGQSLALYSAAYTAGTMTAMAIVAAMATSVVVYYAWQVAATVFVRVVGEEVAAIFAIICMAKATYEFSKVGSVKGAPFARDLLTASTSINAAISSSVMEKMKELQKEMDEFGAVNTAKEKELAAAQKLIERDNIATPIILLGETPKEYFNRTVHSGNIGIVSVTGISLYVSSALTLPRISETIQR